MPEIKPRAIEPKIQLSYTTGELFSIMDVGAEPPYRLIDDNGIVIVWNEEKQAYLEGSALNKGKPVFFDISRDTLEHRWQLVNPTKAHAQKYSNKEEE